MRRGGANPVDDVGVGPGLVDAHTAGQHDGVDRFVRVGRRLGDEFEPGQGGDGPAVNRRQERGVTVVAASHRGKLQRGSGEHLEWAHHVEGLHPAKTEEHHRSRHASIVRRRPGGVYAMEPTN